mmetsp:Transcript_88184/g.248127  ORF Transcript_88184/g.248127 Transcript_88184/m.248127 type:complete len:269 (+) Transcript_88184:552-1358(+)
MRWQPESLGLTSPELSTTIRMSCFVLKCWRHSLFACFAACSQMPAGSHALSTIPLGTPRPKALRGGETHAMYCDVSISVPMRDNRKVSSHSLIIVSLKPLLLCSARIDVARFGITPRILLLRSCTTLVNSERSEPSISMSLNALKDIMYHSCTSWSCFDVSQPGNSSICWIRCANRIGSSAWDSLAARSGLEASRTSCRVIEFAHCAAKKDTSACRNCCKRSSDTVAISPVVPLAKKRLRPVDQCLPLRTTPCANGGCRPGDSGATLV